MAEGFIAEAKKSSRHMGCTSSSVAFPEVAASDHMGSIGEGERALFKLEVTVGDQHDISDTPHGVACVGCLCGRPGPLGAIGGAADQVVPNAACDKRGGGGAGVLVVIAS